MQKSRSSKKPHPEDQMDLDDQNNTHDNQLVNHDASSPEQSMDKDLGSQSQEQSNSSQEGAEEESETM